MTFIELIGGLISLKNKIKDSLWFVDTYYSDNKDPNIQTIQEFEQKGNTALGHFGNN